MAENEIPDADEIARIEAAYEQWRYEQEAEV